MVILALIALALGTLLGYFLSDNSTLISLTGATDTYLIILMILVGVSIGFNDGILEKLKKHTLHIIVVPTCIIIATILGGIVCSFISGYPMNISTAIAAGLGWYSLSGVTMTDFVGAQIGTITFMSSLMREIFSFLTIPFISYYMNYSTAIAPAAATSEDTTLGMMIKYTDAEHVVISLLNGAIISAAVPFLIPFCLAVF